MNTPHHHPFIALYLPIIYYPDTFYSSPFPVFYRHLVVSLPLHITDSIYLSSLLPFSVLPMSLFLCVLYTPPLFCSPSLLLPSSLLSSNWLPGGSGNFVFWLNSGKTQLFCNYTLMEGTHTENTHKMYFQPKKKKKQKPTHAILGFFLSPAIKCARSVYTPEGNFSLLWTEWNHPLNLPVGV